MRAVRAAAAWLLAAEPAAAQVGAGFVAPERDTDSRFGSGFTLHTTRAELRRLFVALGGRVPRPGETLSVTVLDLDLASYERPTAGIAGGLRVVSDIGPPRLRYVLRERGRTVPAAEETVTDIDFLARHTRSTGGGFTDGQALIRDWIKARIARRRPSRG